MTDKVTFEQFSEGCPQRVERPGKKPECLYKVPGDGLRKQCRQPNCFVWSKYHKPEEG